MQGADAREGKFASFSVAQGELLRAARASRQMTLHDVEAVTQGEFKAASLSAYERGERAISVLRLLRIAEVYKTSLEELLPPVYSEGSQPADENAEPPAAAARVEQPAGAQRLRLDLERLGDVEDAGFDQLRNLVGAIQERRRGRTGRYLLLRGEDLWIVAAIFGTTPGEAVAMLFRAGLAKPA